MSVKKESTVFQSHIIGVSIQSPPFFANFSLSSSYWLLFLSSGAGIGLYGGIGLASKCCTNCWTFLFGVGIGVLLLGVGVGRLASSFVQNFGVHCL